MAGYVYFIGTPVFGWYKIGKSTTPDVRIKNLGILLPFKIDVLGVWAAQDHHLMESTLHDMYSASRINGEWFEFTKAEAYQFLTSIPAETRIFPSAVSESALDHFSNIEQDVRKSKKVIGVRTQKLRGNFTDEEREQFRIASIEQQRKNKELGLSNKGLPLPQRTK